MRSILPSKAFCETVLGKEMANRSPDSGIDSGWARDAGTRLMASSTAVDIRIVHGSFKFNLRRVIIVEAYSASGVETS
jgi:hypothetical protein